MAILLLDELEATPNPTTLPRRVDFKQTVQSTVLSGSEQATFRYSMDPSHDVFFKDSNGNLVKEISRDEEISNTERKLHNRIDMVYGPDNEPQALVQITETVVDSQGDEVQTVAILSIDS